MARSLPPLESLWAFHLVAETGSLTAAAAALGVTQPAVSRRLRELETRLGCALVRRSTNALHMTEQGQRYAQEIRRGFQHLENATRNLTAQDAPLRIRAYTTWALRWMIPRMGRFKALHPGLDVEVTTSVADVDLAREGVDAAIRSAPVDRPPAPGARPLQPVVIAPFAAPSLIAARPDDRLPGRLLGSKVRAEDWPRWFRRDGGVPDTAPLLFESTMLAIQAAMEGLGTVICPPSFVQEEVRSGRLTPLAAHGVMAGDRYWLILPQGRVPHALQVFADWLVAEVEASSVT